MVVENLGVRLSNALNQIKRESHTLLMPPRNPATTIPCFPVEETLLALWRSYLPAPYLTRMP